MNALADEIGILGQPYEPVRLSRESNLLADTILSAPVNGAEKRKINRLVARAVALEMLAADTKKPLEPRLMAIDRIEQRWAVSIGSGLPSERYDDTPTARPPPLDDVTAIIVDQINVRAPEGYKRLLKAWYKTPAPAEAIAQSIGISRSSVYLEWRAALQYLHMVFMASGHRDLVNLAQLRG